MTEKPDTPVPTKDTPKDTATDSGDDTSSQLSTEQYSGPKALEAFGSAGATKSTAALAPVEIVDSSVEKGKPVEAGPKEGETKRVATEDSATTVSGDSGERTRRSTEPAAPEYTPLNKEELTQIAVAIDRAANGGFLGIGTDKDAIFEQLKRLRTPEERAALDLIYQDKFDDTITGELEDEFSGSDLEKAKSLWRGENTDSARIFNGLVEHKEWGIGTRSNHIIEKDLRDTLRTMNSQEIETVSTEFRNVHEAELRDSLLQDENLPESTKQALEIYLKGSDERTPEDTLALADIALKSRNLDMFEEAFLDASPEARSRFIEQAGHERILETFGTPVTAGDGMYDVPMQSQVFYMESEDSRHALDYVKQGKLGTVTKLEDNTGIINDSEQGIENALDAMSDAERRSFANGRSLSQLNGAELSEEQKHDVEVYTKIHAALSRAGNDREIAVWEDRIEHPEGSLVSSLAKHGGIVDDGMDEVLRTVEDMPEADWKRLTSDPEFLRRVRSVLAVDLSESEMGRANDLLERKMRARSFDMSTYVRRDIRSALEDESGVEGVVSVLERMTPAEQRDYREKESFRNEVDSLVRMKLLPGFEQKAGFAILDSVKHDENPAESIVSKLYVHALDFDTKEDKVVQDLEEALSKPELRHRLATDPEFKRDFDKALGAALEPWEVRRYAQPIIDEGRLPFARKAELYNHVFDDVKGLIGAVERGSDQDWQEILADPRKTLPFLSKDEREVVANVARQNGEFRPEDKLRLAMIGAGTDTTSVESVLEQSGVKATQETRTAFLAKYKSDLLGDLMGEVGGDDRQKIIPELQTHPRTGRETFNDARGRVYNSVDGFGRALVDGFSGIGDATIDTLNQYSRAMEVHSRKFEEMPPEQREKFEEQLNEALVLYREAEDSAADTLVDGVIIGASVLAAPTGVGLVGIAYAVAGGAVLKVGAKAAIRGSDYDFASADLWTDSATGATDVASMFIAPLQMGKMLGIGAKSAKSAVSVTLASADELAIAGGKAILKEGAEAQLERGLLQAVTEGIVHGADAVDDKALLKLATEVASSPEDIPQVKQLIEDSLRQAIAKESANSLKSVGREVALNGAAGNAAGSVSGLVYSGAEWDSSLTTEQNLANIAKMTLLSGGMGTAMGAGFTALFRGVPAMTRAGSEVANVADELPPGAILDPRPPRTRLNGATHIEGPSGRIEIGYHAGGELDGNLANLRMADGVELSTTDGIRWNVKEPPGGAAPYEVQGRFDVAEDGTLTFLPAGSDPIVISPDGRYLEINRNTGAASEVSSSRLTRDVDGRPYGNRARVTDRFEELNPTERSAAMGAVSEDLSRVRAVGSDGSPTSVLDSLMSDPTLSAEQKQRVIYNLSEIREHLATYRQGSRMHPDPEVNWIHTQGELGKVLESSRANGLSGEEMEDALLASMYSDSYKFAFPPPEGATPNFFTHHLDGALAAQEMLSRQGFPPERVARIVQAIKEHQVAPPEFMGLLYHGQIMRGLSRQLDEGIITAEEHAQKLEVLRGMTMTREIPNGPTLSYIKPIAQVNDAPLVKGADGHYEVDFTPEQRELLKLAGVERWSVPHDPRLDPSFEQLPGAEQASLLSTYRISRALIDGDGIDNYATLGGASKIVTIRGPETIFKDATVWKSVDSVDTSFKDAYAVLTPEGQRLANESLALRNRLLHDGDTGIKTQMDDWLRQKGLDPETDKIPFYNEPLKYPEPLSNAEQTELGRLSLEARQAAGEDPSITAVRDARIRELKYKGLSEDEIGQYEFAKEIRSEMADRMRRQHRTDGSLPGEFENTRERLGLEEGILSRRAGEQGDAAHHSIVGDRGNDGSLWRPMRNLDDLDIEDRFQLKEILEGKQSPLAEPEFIWQYLDTVLPRMDGWNENYTKTYTRVSELRRQILDQQGTYTDLSIDAGLGIGHDTGIEKSLREFYKNDPQNLAFIDSFLSARREHAELRLQLKEALEPRRKQIEDALNEVVAKMSKEDGSLSGLPPVRVIVEDPQFMGSAVASFGNGEIRISMTELLSNRSMANVIGSAYHEMTHNEQQTTIVRHLADVLGIGKVPTADQRGHLADLYRQRTGRNLPDEYMDSVLAIRDGQSLPSEAGQRAEALADAFSRNKPVGEEWTKLGNDYRLVERDIRKLFGKTDEKSPAYRILHSLGETRDRRALAQRYFGSDDIPADVQKYIDAYKKFERGDDSAWNHSVELEARRALLVHLMERTETINNRRRELYDGYMQVHEHDAWVAGERVRMAAVARDVPHRDQEPSLLDEIEWLR